MSGNAQRSMLTSGLEEFADKSETMRCMISRLYELDAMLQTTHKRAKKVDEEGEQVVLVYREFVGTRQKLIKLIEEKHLVVPWTLRVQINDLERTVSVS